MFWGMNNKPSDQFSGVQTRDFLKQRVDYAGIDKLMINCIFRCNKEVNRKLGYILRLQEWLLF